MLCFIFVNNTKSSKELKPIVKLKNYKGWDYVLGDICKNSSFFFNLQKKYKIFENRNKNHLLDIWLIYQKLSTLSSFWDVKTDENVYKISRNRI